MTDGLTNKQRYNGVLPKDTEAVIVDYKEPLREVEDGYGYLGVLETNKEETHLRCHICGLFYKKLSTHIKRTHEMEPADYKEKFRLNKSKGLVTEKQRSVYREVIENQDSLAKLKHITGLKKGRDKIIANRKKGMYRVRSKSLQERNKNGSCPDQLLDKVEKLAEELGRVPTQREYAKKHGKMYAIAQTYGSWGNVLKILNMKQQPSGSQVYTEQDVITMMRDFYEQHGRKPKYADFKHTRGLPSPYVLNRCFGSYAKAIQTAFNTYEVDTAHSGRRGL